MTYELLYVLDTHADLILKDKVVCRLHSTLQTAVRLQEEVHEERRRYMVVDKCSRLTILGLALLIIRRSRIEACVMALGGDNGSDLASGLWGSYRGQSTVGGFDRLQLDVFDLYVLCWAKKADLLAVVA